jgi:hypothetical protein
MDVSAWMREQEIRRDIDGFASGAARARWQKIHEAKGARQNASANNFRIEAGHAIFVRGRLKIFTKRSCAGFPILS